MLVRSPLILLGPVAGLVLAGAGWMLLGGSSRAVAPIDRIEQQVLAIPASRLGSVAVRSDVATAIAKPLFPEGLGRISIRLDGLSRSPGRTAALFSFNGGATQWVTLGSTVSGVTVVAISGSRASVDTATGRRDIRLGETVGEPPAPTGAGVTSPAAPAGDEPPPGTRLFPPASAPGGQP